MLHVHLPNRSFYKTGAFEAAACRDSVRWGLYRFVICWSMLMHADHLDRCHFGQRTILRWTWLCWWPVLDAEAVLGSSNFVILNFSWFYSILPKKKNCTSKPPIPGLHTQLTRLSSRSLRKRVAIAHAMSFSDMVLQSSYNTSGPSFMSMNPSATLFLSRWSLPHGGCGG